MFNIQALTPDAKLYFENLPLHIQEMLVQTSLHITTKEELVEFVNNLNKN